MNTPAPIRVRLCPESNKPEKIYVLEYKRQWMPEDHLWRGGPKSSEQEPSKTYGQTIREHFFSQPAALGFDPLTLNAQNDAPEEGVTWREVWAEPAAAIIAMTVGFRHLRSQYFRSSCFVLGKALRTGGTKKWPVDTARELRGLAACQRDDAIKGVRVEYWEALWPYLEGTQQFFYRIANDAEGFVDEHAEHIWLSPSFSTWPVSVATK